MRECSTFAENFWKMQITDNVYYVGVNDRTKHRFEGLWALPLGVSYNAYLVVSDKVALIDTVEADFFGEFLAKIRAVLGERKIDYLVVNHMEPDHSGSLELIRRYYPEIRVVGNAKTHDMVRGFFGPQGGDDIVVKEGDRLSLGGVEMQFHLAPMLHWPETMVTYLPAQGILFSGDAFGCFGALNGAVLDSRMDCTPYFPEMERYFAAILGKFCAPVRTALKKLSGLDIRMICSTHGPVWTENAARAVETYRRMSHGETEPGLVVCYGSMYGNTQRVAEAVAEGAAAAGLRHIAVHNLSVSQPSYVLADIFRYNALAVGGPTYNGGVFPVVEDLLRRLAGRQVEGRHLACFGGYTWASAAVKTIHHYNEKMKMQWVADPLEWKQAPDADALAAARRMGEALAHAALSAGAPDAQ